MKKTRKNRHFSKAFTLIEVLMTIALMGIITGISLTAMDEISSDIAFDRTYGKMMQIKRALVGDLDANRQGLRDYYGYLGDVGNLPTSYQGLQALLTRPTEVAAWAMNTTAKVGVGWRGPYLPSTNGVDWLKDSWGNNIQYNTTGTPYIRSLGADAAVGGTGPDQDIQIDLGTNLTTATVHGIINANGERFSDDAVVKFYYPLSGTLQTLTATLTAADNGYFSFSNIPFGLRSFKIFFPDESDPDDTLGPSLVSIDSSNYVIPHNYLDSSPGALPHTCANTSRISLVTGSVEASADTDRVYFEVDISESITIQSIFLAVDNGATFRGMRIGNDTKNCDGSASTGFECMIFDLFSIFGLEDTSAPYETNPENFPEINLDGPGSTVTPWVIPAGSKRGAYVQLSSVSSLGRLELRIACDYLRLLEE